MKLNADHKMMGLSPHGYSAAVIVPPGGEVLLLQDVHVQALLPAASESRTEAVPPSHQQAAPLEKAAVAAKYTQGELAATLIPGAPASRIATKQFLAAKPMPLPQCKNAWEKAADKVEATVSGLGALWLRLTTPNPDSSSNIRKAVNEELDKLQESAMFDTTPRALIPALRKLHLNPVEFYTARACWQGVDTKRRQTLGSVISQFPTLPAGQKTWKAAVETARAQGTSISRGDEYFIRFFFENRKALKALFRISLNQWQGNTIVCYRGRRCKVEENDGQPLECYSLDPKTSMRWAYGTGNLQRHRVKLSAVWSTFTVMQNKNRDELELTVYSAGGKRRGKLVYQTVEAEEGRFKATFKNNAFTRQPIFKF